MGYNYEEKIKEYIDNLFKDEPQTRKIKEFKGELLSNSLDKYYSLLENSIDEDTAYNKVISRVENIDNLLKKDILQVTKESYYKKKSAKITAIAVMMYILSPVSVIIFDNLGSDTWGIVIMFVLVAIATGLLIYNNMTKPRDYNNHDNLDEDFNGCKNSNNKSIRIRKSIESAMWAIIVVIYLLISFITFAWHITWIIFVIGAAIEKIIRAYFEYREID